MQSLKTTGTAYTIWNILLLLLGVKEVASAPECVTTLVAGEECADSTFIDGCGSPSLSSWLIQSVARQGCPSADYLSYTLCSQSPVLKSGTAASTWTFKDTATLWVAGTICRRRRLLDHHSDVAYSLGHLLAKPGNSSCSLGFTTSGGLQSCTGASVNLATTSKPLLLGLGAGTRPGRYTIFVEGTIGCQRYLGVAPGCTDTKLQWYDSDKGNLTEWEFRPSPGPATAPTITSATSIKALCMCCDLGNSESYAYRDYVCANPEKSVPIIAFTGGYQPELRISDPPTGPPPNYYAVKFQSSASEYIPSSNSFTTISTDVGDMLMKKGGKWEDQFRSRLEDRLPACTAYKASIKGYFINPRGQWFGSNWPQCEIAASEGVSLSEIDWCDQSGALRAFHYVTPPSAQKSAKTGGCGAKPVKLQLAKKRTCAVNTEYASYKNVACGASGAIVGALSSNWVLNVTGNGLVTLRVKAPTGTTLKCKGAYLAPQSGCQESGVVLQSTPYKWRMHAFVVEIQDFESRKYRSDVFALVAESKAKACRRVLGVSTNCASNSLALYTEASSKLDSNFGWIAPPVGSFPAPTVASVSSNCSTTTRQCDATVTFSTTSSIQPSVYELIYSKDQYSKNTYHSKSTAKIQFLIQCASYTFKARYLVGDGFGAVWSPYSTVKTARMGNCGNPVQWRISPVYNLNCTKRNVQYLNVGSGSCAAGAPKLGSLSNSSSVWTFGVVDVDTVGKNPFDEYFPETPAYKLASSPEKISCASKLDVAKSCGLSANATASPVEWFAKSVGSGQAYIRLQMGKCKRYIGISKDCTSNALVLYNEDQKQGLNYWRLETIPKGKPVITAANMTCGLKTQPLDYGSSENVIRCICTSTIKLIPSSPPKPVAYQAYYRLPKYRSSVWDEELNDEIRGTQHSMTIDASGQLVLQSTFEDGMSFKQGDTWVSGPLCYLSNRCDKVNITAVGMRRVPASTLEIDAVSEPFAAMVCKG